MIFHCSVPKKGLVGNRSAASIRLPARLFEPGRVPALHRGTARPRARLTTSINFDQILTTPFAASVMRASRLCKKLVKPVCRA